MHSVGIDVVVMNSSAGYLHLMVAIVVDSNVDDGVSKTPMVSIVWLMLMPMPLLRLMTMLLLIEPMWLLLLMLHQIQL